MIFPKFPYLFFKTKYRDFVFLTEGDELAHGYSNNEIRKNKFFTQLFIQQTN